MKEKFSESDKQRARALFDALGKLAPGEPHTVLNSSNNWELLVAVQLSAQCTDKKVNEITPVLFKKYPTLEDYVKAGETSAGVQEFERAIFQTGFYRNKTKNILAAAKMVKEKFRGEIPKTMSEMLTIPGVARKTANVVLGNAYGVVEGIAVDTHVMRLAQMFGLTRQKTPEKIEQDLIELYPQKDWFTLTYRLIDYGRKYCKATKHDHENCPLTKEFGVKIPWELKNK
jgi:endonuclease-3